MRRPCLTEDAYPSLNENLPAYYSSEPAMKRRCPNQRRQEILLKEAETQREMKVAVAERDVISTYENLLAYVRDYDKKNGFLMTQKNFSIFLKSFQESHFPYIFPLKLIMI